MKEFPYKVYFTHHEEPVLYEAWLTQQPAIKIKEIVTLFRWDSGDGKVEDSESGFNDYLVKHFRQDLAQGWSISEEIDQFKLLPLEIQRWHDSLYYYNQLLLNDLYRDDDRYPDFEYAELIQEIYDDQQEKAEWSIAIPNTSSIESSFAWWQIVRLLSDDEGFDSPKDYFNHCQYWKGMKFEKFKSALVENLKENEVFEQEFLVEHENYDGDETSFLREIEFRDLYDFLHTDYNGWPSKDMPIV